MDDVNLIPGAVLEQRQRLARMRFWSVVCLVVLLLLPSGAVILHRHVATVSQRVVSLRQQQTQLAQHLEQLKVLHERQQQLRAREKLINLLYTRVPLPQLFFDITALTDEQLWLTQIGLHKASVTPAGQAPPPPAQQPAASFFTLGRAATPGKDQPVNGQKAPITLLVQGHTTSTQRLTDFMAGLTTVSYLSKINLQVARRGALVAPESIEFVIEIQL